MKRWMRTMMTAVVLALPTAAAAQTPEAPAPRGERGIPVEALLRVQEELGLSADQVARLEQIGQRLQAQNEPLVAQLRESGAWPGARAGAARQLTPEEREEMRRRMQERREATPEQRERMRERARSVTPEQRREMARRFRVPAELQPTVAQLRANNLTALEEARSVLTAEQIARANELIRERFSERRPGRGNVAPRRGR